jgi:tRNA pseudouridine13 synthase
VKIKVRPEDFVVEEITSIPLGRSGPFAVFTLTKQGWNTVDLLRRLSRELGIPSAHFAYGGKKDRYGRTSQCITIDTKGLRYRAGLSVAEKNYSLRPLGRSDRQMGPDLIQANRFEITIRDLGEQEAVRACSETRSVTQQGYPNYFDDQRFGSYDPVQGFIAEKLLKRHYNGALKIYLTSIRREDKRETKERKQFLLAHWGQWQTCLKRVETPFEKASFSFLAHTPKGFIPLLQRISREEMSLFIAAYQSFLWNELLRRIVTRLAKEGQVQYPGVVGDYIFYTDLPDSVCTELRNLILPSPSATAEMPGAFVTTLYRDILKEREVAPSMFNLRSLRQAFFKSTGRNAIVFPGSLRAEAGDDDIYPDRKKVVLRFALPRGSYGTMLVKRLFSAPAEKRACSD